MNKCIFHYALSSFLVGGIALSVTSCADDDLDNGGTNGNGAVVRFSVNDVQEGAISRGVVTRGAITPGLGSSDLAGGKLTAHSNRNIDVCLIETTVEGVNPVKADAHTRAEIINTSTLGDFSASGIRGTSASTILTTPEWFHAKKTKSNGELYSPIYWNPAQPFGRFFAVSPNTESYSKMTINNTDANGSPSVEFEVNTDVTKEVDLMTACTGDVEYATQGVQPTTNLDFRHALTGIRFAVGQNLSWNKTIDKVELRNVLLKSKYKLSKQFNGTGAAWDHTGYSMRGNAVLSGVSVSTSQNPNVTIMGNDGDNYTFYMIPQQLTGLVTAYVHCTDGTTITVPLKGEWKAGTTRTYKLSQTNSTWTYTLEGTNPTRAANYDETTSQAYSIKSYREDPATHVQQAVAWKVVGYDANGDGTFTMAEKPAWLTSLSKTQGDGGTAADQGTATLTKDVTDLLAKRNKGLKEATALGSASDPYDLSTKGGSVNRSTANSYVISAPGHYRIPLVYGNAIENGATNANSYISHAPTGTSNEQYVLRTFKDHNNQDITDPWIEKTNGGANSGVNGAEVVWADAADLVHSPSIAHVGSDAFLDFTVSASDIQSGNAVVAVKKGNTIVWSWHLWFAPKDALDKIKVTNHQNIDYYFTKENLGWKPTQWSGSTYDKARTIKVKVVQTIKNGGVAQEAVINITQNPGGVKKGATTLYQFGRKDAFPGVDASELAANSHFIQDAGNNMSIMNGIQHPDYFYRVGSSWYSAPPTGYSYYNLWSADNTTTGFNDNSVVKTVYDPCPVGFKMPASNAFTGFTADGQNHGTMNVGDTSDWQTYQNDFGHNFWTNSSKTATINFPSSGYRTNGDGSLYNASVGGRGWYWSAVLNSEYDGCNLQFFWSDISPVDREGRASGFAARPVAE
jgi:conserved domain protein